jgi:hypothetical protein
MFTRFDNAKINAVRCRDGDILLVGLRFCVEGSKGDLSFLSLAPLFGRKRLERPGPSWYSGRLCSIGWCRLVQVKLREFRHSLLVRLAFVVGSVHRLKKDEPTGAAYNIVAIATVLSVGALPSQKGWTGVDRHSVDAVKEIEVQKEQRKLPVEEVT